VRKSLRRIVVLRQPRVVLQLVRHMDLLLRPHLEGSASALGDKEAGPTVSIANQSERKEQKRSDSTSARLYTGVSGRDPGTIASVETASRFGKKLTK
jgi:hypothetical protein